MYTILAKPPSPLQNPCGISISSTSKPPTPPPPESSASTVPSATPTLSCRCCSPALARSTIPTPFPRTVPTTETSYSGGAGPWWWRFFMTVFMVFWLMWNTLVDVGYFMATVLFLKDSETPLKTPARTEFSPTRLVYRTVSLEDMKLIKNAMNLTINDVALGVTQAGLSQYLNRRYGEGRKDEAAAEEKNNFPKKKIRLHTMRLINIRPSSDIQALADMMEKNNEAKWESRIGYVILPFTIGLRDDPLDYV